MKIYFDTEFTGLHKNTTLISIGLIDENNRMFYGIFDDYDKSQVTEWIEQHVLSNLTFECPSCMITNNRTLIRGDKKKIKKELQKWLDEGNYKLIEFVSDVAHYDFVLLIDLLYNDALLMPDNVTPACIDLNSDIARYKNINAYGAFSVNREKLLYTINTINMLTGHEVDEMVDDILSVECKHNALYDAIIIKFLYENINKYI